jgi:hypothetical protein
MNKKSPPHGQSTSVEPGELPESSPPRDLYATSDIRFVTLEIGKLTAKVDRLIEDVSAQSTKVDVMQHQISYVKGGVRIALFLIPLIGAIVWFFTSAKFAAVLEALKR